MPTIFWFRRDLRLTDNAGLYYALREKQPVVPVFIFDTTILDALTDRDDRRVSFIYLAIEQLKHDLEQLGSSLDVRYGNPVDVLPQLVAQYKSQSVFANHDYEPAAISRDSQVADALQTQNVAFRTYKDQVIFEKSEVLTAAQTPYSVFTPYSRAWKHKLSDFYLKPYPTERYFGYLLRCEPLPLLRLEQMNFKPNFTHLPPAKISDILLKNYAEKRDFPAQEATSRLSVHLRFGTVSIRALVAKALQTSEIWLNELIWREFYMMILFHYPHVVGKAFRPAYDRIVWRNNEAEFARWCAGQTGYPIVDAGMRQLNETGFMHNRVRMITASFLVKHLLIDWRWGEAYFAQKLIDFELASNNGGWQWAASSGCDAVPYFRIFNPALQTQKFDPQGVYIRRWVSEIDKIGQYPRPIVVHEQARVRVLAAYKTALKGEE